MFSAFAILVLIINYTLNYSTTFGTIKHPTSFAKSAVLLCEDMSAEVPDARPRGESTLPGKELIILYILC